MLGSQKKPLCLYKRVRVQSKHSMEITLMDGKLKLLKWVFEQVFSGDIENHFDSQVLWAKIYPSSPGSSKIKIGFDFTVSEDEASSWINLLESKGLGYATKIKLNKFQSAYKFKSLPEFHFSGLLGKGHNLEVNVTKVLNFKDFLPVFRKIKDNRALTGFKIRKPVVSQISQATNSVLVPGKNWRQVFTGLVKLLFFESSSDVRDVIESLTIQFKKDGALILLYFTEDALSGKGQVDLVNLINGVISAGLTDGIYESVVFDCIDTNKSKSLILKNSKLGAFLACSAFAQDSIFKLSEDIITDLPLGLANAINMVEWSSTAWKMIIIEESLLKDELHCIRQKSMSISLINISTSIGKFYQPGSFITIHPEEDSINLIMEVFRVGDTGDLKKWKLSNKIESFQQYSAMKPWLSGMSIQQASPFKSSDILKIQMDSDKDTVKDDLISKVFEDNETIAFKCFGPNLIELHLDRASSNNEPVFNYLGDLSLPSVYSNSHILIGDLPLFTVTFHGGKPVQLSNYQDFFCLKSKHKCDPRHVGKCIIKRISKENCRSTLFYRSEKISSKLYSAKMKSLLTGILGRKAISDFQVAISSIAVERAGDNFEFRISCFDVAIEIKTAKHFKHLFETIFTVRPQPAARSTAPQPRKYRALESPKASNASTCTTETNVESDSSSDEIFSPSNSGDIPLESNIPTAITIESMPPTSPISVLDEIPTLKASTSNFTAESKFSDSFEGAAPKEELSSTETSKATVSADQEVRKPAIIRFAGLESDFCLELASKPILTGSIGYSDGLDSGVYHDMDSAISWALVAASRLHAAEISYFVLRFHEDYPNLLTSDSMFERHFRPGSMNERRFFDSLNFLVKLIAKLNIFLSSSFFSKIDRIHRSRSSSFLDSRGFRGEGI